MDAELKVFRRFMLVSRLAALAVAAGCGPDTDASGAVPLAGARGCQEGALDPATAAPAVGLWAGRGGDQVHVSARVGPPQPSGSTSGPVRHRVETLESLPGKPPLRASHDSATVRLDLLPLYADDRPVPEAAKAARKELQPAATYAVSDLVALASYESCALTDPEPRVRYFRRDGSGRVVTDLMLYRQSASP